MTIQSLIASELFSESANNENIDNSLNFLYYPDSNNDTSVLNNNNNNNNIYFYLFTTAINKAQTMTSTASTVIDSNGTLASKDCSLDPSFIFEEKLCYLYIMFPIAVIGIILNIISIKIFSDKSFNTVAFSYLRLMTWVDLFICPIVIIYCITGYTKAFHKYDLYIRNLYVAYIYIPLANILSNLTMLLKLLVTVERLISVRWPTKKYKLFKTSRYYLSCFIVTLIAIFFNFLYFFMYKVQVCVGLQPRAFTNGAFWKIFGYVKEVLMRVVPIVLLVGANALLVYTVKMSRKRMNKNKSKTKRNSTAISANGNNAIDVAAHKRSRQDFQLTVMTIAVAAMYTICSIPMIFAYPGLVFHANQLESKLYRIYAASVNILELIQSSFRFIIYYSFTTQFRQLFLQKYSKFLLCSKSQTSAHSSENEPLNSKNSKDKLKITAQASVMITHQ